MTHEKKSRHQHFQNKKEDEGDGLLAASHRIFNNSVSIQNSNMASSSKEVMPLSSSSSLSSAESKVSFSSADCSVSSRHGNVITGENTRHHHLLYHSYYKTSSSTSFSPPRHEVPSSSSANPECSEMYNFGHENSRYTVDRIRQQRNQNIYSNCSELRFGPKGTLLDNTKLLTIPDQTGQKLKWIECPQTVLVLKKSFGDNMSQPFVDVLMWLICEKKMKVFVESKVVVHDERYESIKNQLQIFNQDKDDLTDRIDFVICLGGDGTLMYAASLFQKCVPPVMSFHFGSLGFLAPFQFQDFKEDITQVLEGNSNLLLRSRLECTVCKLNTDDTQSKWKNILVLNEVVLDRGLSPYLCNLDLYVEKHLVTSIQGDGVIISTPTGSTAYAVAAGASMMHPSVPSIMITPICPHSLSFRPIVVPAEVEIKLIVSKESRNTAWVSFDGRSRQELQIGDCVKIKTAVHPFPSICLKDPIDDWFNSLAECLHWNMRKLQRGPSSTPSIVSLDSVEFEHNHCT